MQFGQPIIAPPPASATVVHQTAPPKAGFQFSTTSCGALSTAAIKKIEAADTSPAMTQWKHLLDAPTGADTPRRTGM